MRRQLIFISIIIFITFLDFSLFCQEHNRVERMQDSLLVLTKKIKTAGNDSARFHYNALFKQTLRQALSVPASFDFPFDSLKTLSRLTAGDKKFRIYTWNIPKGDGTFKYFGVIQLNPRENRNAQLFDLSDHSDSITDAEFKRLDPDHWYGSLYYRIILTKFHDQTFYTLLGWHGSNSLLTQKVIEVLIFDYLHHPRFGAMIFRNYGNDKICRIIFKYSSTAAMYLDYDEQFLPEKKKWNPSKKQFETEKIKKHMIVCDELIPREPILEGQFEYYIPSSEMFDGFVFMDGFWNFFSNIDARNK